LNEWLEHASDQQGADTRLYDNPTYILAAESLIHKNGDHAAYCR
jgi:hypothetical protein